MKPGRAPDTYLSLISFVWLRHVSHMTEFFLVRFSRTYANGCKDGDTASRLEPTLHPDTFRPVTGFLAGKRDKT